MPKIISSSFIIVCLFFVATTTAQTGAKSVYFELGGAGIASINYDMRLQNKEGGLGFKVGVGGFSIEGSSAVFVPIGLNYLLGKDERNYFEIGGGITIVSYKEDYFFSDNSSNFTSSFGHAYFGYRLQPKNGGFLFRAGITPVFTKEGFIPYWAGISFGYKF